jgi:hypothetical protein
MAHPDPTSPRWSTRRQQRSAMGAACGRLVASSPGLVELPESGRRRLELAAGGWRHRAAELSSPGVWLGPYVRGRPRCCWPNLIWLEVPCRPYAREVRTPRRPDGGSPLVVPLVGPVGRTTRGRLAPRGGVVRPRRMVRFARLTDAARPRSWACLRPAPPAAAIRRRRHRY